MAGGGGKPLLPAVEYGAAWVSVWHRAGANVMTSASLTAAPAQTSSQPRSLPNDGPLEGMHPAYVAIVMATGIVSIACHLLGLQLIGRGLFWLDAIFYVVLWVLTILRCARYPKKVQSDLMHHGRSVGFFTLVAATCVLGS